MSNFKFIVYSRFLIEDIEANEEKLVDIIKRYFEKDFPLKFMKIFVLAQEKKVVEETVDDKPIVELKEKLDKINEDINVLNNNKNINNDKKNKVQQFLAIFTKKYKERMNIKIDLVKCLTNSQLTLMMLCI